MDVGSLTVAFYGFMSVHFYRTNRCICVGLTEICNGHGRSIDGQLNVIDSQAVTVRVGVREES